MAKSTLEVKTRDQFGKSSLKRLREENIPAVAYGKGHESIALIVNYKKLKKALETPAKKNTLIDLKIDTDSSGKPKENKLVVIKDIQIDFLSQKPIHIDFQIIKENEEITIKVPIKLTGRAKAQGIKSGGILEETMQELEVKCRTDNIPDYIEFDILDMQLGSVLHLKDLTLPKGVTALGNSDDIIASIQIPRALITEADIGKQTQSESDEPDSTDTSTEQAS